MMSDTQLEALCELRDQGFSVVVFNPSELEGADPGMVQDRLVELGWDVIEQLRDPNYEDHDENQNK